MRTRVRARCVRARVYVGIHFTLYVVNYIYLQYLWYVKLELNIEIIGGNQRGSQRNE